MKNFLKILILLTLPISALYGSEIYFEKDDIFITKKDLNNYQKLYKDFYGQNISNGKAVKNLYLMIKIIDKQVKKNPNFDAETNRMILNQIEEFGDTYSQYILKYFLKYEILKKDFIQDYINKINISDLNININFGIKLSVFQSNNCNKKIKDIVFDQLSDLEKKIVIQNYNNKIIETEENLFICLNEDNIKNISENINNFLSINGYEEFLEYVFKTIK